MRCHFYSVTAAPEMKFYDARTPGIFKVECTGDGIAALSNKTYRIKTSTYQRLAVKE